MPWNQGGRLVARVGKGALSRQSSNPVTSDRGGWCETVDVYQHLAWF